MNAFEEFLATRQYDWDRKILKSACPVLPSIPVPMRPLLAEWMTPETNECLVLFNEGWNRKFGKRFTPDPCPESFYIEEPQRSGKWKPFAGELGDPVDP